MVKTPLYTRPQWAGIDTYAGPRGRWPGECSARHRSAATSPSRDKDTIAAERCRADGHGPGPRPDQPQAIANHDAAWRGSYGGTSGNAALATATTTPSG